jgi:PAS domain S-box-containing protein
VLEGLPDGLLVVDGEGIILEANTQAALLFGYEPGGMRGMSVDLLVPEAWRGVHGRQRDGFARNLVPRPMGAGLELVGLRQDGEEIPLAISLRPLGGATQAVRVVAVIRDLRDTRRLRAFRAAVLRAAEEERRRIARELHDDTAQRLAALLLRLRVSRRPSDDEGWQRLSGEFRGEIQAIADGVRRIARNLRPPALEDVGVEAAIQGYAAGLRDTWGGQVELTLDPVGDHLSDEARVVLYRVVQEACTNVVRHSGAGTLHIRLRGSEDAVCAEVEDDGDGFDPEEAVRAGGLGLLGMSERAELLGGQVSIESRPGRGVRVCLTLPTVREIPGE